MASPIWYAIKATAGELQRSDESPRVNKGTSDAQGTDKDAANTENVDRARAGPGTSNQQHAQKTESHSRRFSQDDVLFT